MTNCLKTPIQQVIYGGFCIGCGGCAVSSEGVKMEFDQQGLLQPSGEIKSLDYASEVCPFSASRDEDSIGASLYSSPRIRHDPWVGHYHAIYAGHVSVDELRSRGSSSGFVSWLLIELLERGLIDGVIHVTSREQGASLFEYGISRTPSEVIDAAKSKYHPAHFDQAVNDIKGDGKRYAFVGVPCFIKAMRLICEQDEILSKQIRFCIALVCGHMKTAMYSEFIAAQLGVSSDQLGTIDFRVKDLNQPANRYKCSVELRGKTKRIRSLPNSRLYGVDWGLGYFKPKACEWCDDIVGELADVSSGDAWLPEYVADSMGNNIIIVRSRLLRSVIIEGRKSGALRLQRKTVADVYKSQAGNYRHRREGLSVRVGEAQALGIWHPIKRVKSDSYRVEPKRKEIYLQRGKLSELSHRLFLSRNKDPLWFLLKIAPDEIAYYRANNRLMVGSLKLLIHAGRLLARRLKYSFFH